MNALRNILSLASALICSVCALAQQGGQYTVSGTLPSAGQSGKMLYLRCVDNGKAIDSLRLNGTQFSFSGSVDTPMFCMVGLDGSQPSYLILEPGHITVGMGDGKRLSPSGTAMNDEMAAIAADLQRANDKLSARLDELAKQKLPDNEMQQQVQACLRDEEEYHKTHGAGLFAKHGNDALGEYLLRTNFFHSLSDEDKMQTISSFGPWLRSRARVERTWRGLKAKAETQSGAMYRDIAGRNEHGQPVSLSDYVGKGDYVLVDFWASWCGPCRREIPNIARLHDMYSGKGLTIVGVFVWDKDENLPKAIGSEGIKWPQIIDANDDASSKYGISSIPQIMLIGPDGKIVARDLRGEKMINFVGEKMASLQQ